MKQKRIEWVDCCKGLAIALVVLGHSLQEYMGENNIAYFLIYSVHMPLFIFLSGYVTRKPTKPFAVFASDKGKRLLPPYILFCVLITVAHFLQDVLLHSRYFADMGKATVINTLLFTYKSMFANLWYLPTLFVATCMHNLLLKRIPNFRERMILAFVISFSVLVLRKWCKLPIPFHIDAVMLSIFFLELGYSCKENMWEIEKKVPILLLGYVVSTTAQIALQSKALNFYRADAGFPLMALVSAVSGTLLIVTAMKHLSASRLLRTLGCNSLYIYGFHFIVQNIVQVAVVHMLLSNLKENAIKPVLAVACGVLTLALACAAAAAYQYLSSFMRKQFAEGE